MGFFDSKSTSTTLQTSTTSDNRVAASDNAIALSGGANLVQNDVSDVIAAAAIDAGVKTVSMGADLVRDIQGQSLDFGSRAVNSAQSIADHALDASVDTVRGNSQLAQTLAEVAITNVEKNKRDPTDDTLQTVVQTVGKYGAIGLGVIVAGGVTFFILRRAK